MPFPWAKAELHCSEWRGLPRWRILDTVVSWFLSHSGFSLSSIHGHVSSLPSLPTSNLSVYSWISTGSDQVIRLGCRVSGPKVLSFLGTAIGI